MFYGRRRDYLRGVVKLFYNLHCVQNNICEARMAEEVSLRKSFINWTLKGLQLAYETAEELGLLEDRLIEELFSTIRHNLLEGKLGFARSELSRLLDEIAYFLYPEMFK